MNTSFSRSFAFNDRSPGDGDSVSVDLDSDSDSNISDFFSSELHGWEPSGNVANRHPSISQGGYGLNLLTPETSSNGDPTTSFDNSVVCETQNRSMSTKKSKKKRMPVPMEKKDEKYWERRRKNNLAAKRSRELRRQKQLNELQMADKTIQENEKLRAEIGVYKSEIESLRRLLRDANTTLALWIKARQATEPLNQLPPTMRDCDGPLHFVDFPQ